MTNSDFDSLSIAVALSTAAFDNSAEGRALFLEIWRGLTEDEQMLVAMAQAKTMGMMGHRLDTICDLSQGAHLRLIGAAAAELRGDGS